MNRQTSICLDLIRFLAALVVFTGHTSGQRMTGGFLWPVAPFMSEAVTVFFVLSGYVIGYVTDKKEFTATVFSTARAARVYSVAIPALLLTFALDAIGRLINPAAYSASWGYNSENPVWQLIANSLFINELWFSNVTPGSNLPFWSLGYEVWYYVMFGLYVFLSGWRRIVAISLTLAFVGPPIAAMFPLWLAGVGCYRLSRTLRIKPRAGGLLCAACLAGWVGYEAWASRNGRLVGLAPSLLRQPELAQDYVIAIFFVGCLLGFNAVAETFTFPQRAANLIRWVAGATFSLYLFHLPIAQFLSALSPWPLSSTAEPSAAVPRNAVGRVRAGGTDGKKEGHLAHRYFQADALCPVTWDTIHRKPVRQLRDCVSGNGHYGWAVRVTSQLFAIQRQVATNKTAARSAPDARSTRMLNRPPKINAVAPCRQLPLRAFRPVVRPLGSLCSSGRHVRRGSRLRGKLRRLGLDHLQDEPRQLGADLVHR